MAPEAPDEYVEPFPMDFDELLASMSPASRRNWDRHGLVIRWEMALWRHVPWMRWPLLRYVYGFWSNLMEEGVRETCKPRWGMVTFAYLNDGMKPTLWHTWKQVMDPNGPYDGIYPGGAPRNRAEADAIAERAMNGDGAGL
jgi:hypothetical protein